MGDLRWIHDLGTKVANNITSGGDLDEVIKLAHDDDIYSFWKGQSESGLKP